MPPKAVSIDDVDIDFSTVGAPSKTSHPSGEVEKLLQEKLAGDGGGKGVGGLQVQDKAIDPFLTPKLHSSASSVNSSKARRQRQLFSTPDPSSTLVEEKKKKEVEEEVKNNTNNTSNDNNTRVIVIDKEKTEEELDKLAENAELSESEWKEILFRYRQQLKSYCSLSSSATTATVPKEPIQKKNFSLIADVFKDGVPDIEPWDRYLFDVLRYDEKHALYHGGTVLPTAKTPPPNKIKKGAGSSPYTDSAALDLTHRPALPLTTYMRYYYTTTTNASQEVDASRYPTREEKREEKRARLLAKQQRIREEKEAAKKRGESSIQHDRLHSKNLSTSLFSTWNPIAADTFVLEQYQQRSIEHQKRNHQRHLEAIPHQILKRRRDTLRHATEQPTFRAYRVFPVQQPTLLAKLRLFANDNLLRGFVLYTAQCDALVVLTGGETAMRHVERWILEKMRWGREETVATRLCRIPIPDACSFSFHLPPLSHTTGRKALKEEEDEKEGKKGGAAAALARATATTGDTPLNETEEELKKQPVFVKFVETAMEGEQFLTQVPCRERKLMSDLSAVWRHAFLGDVYEK